MSDELRTRKLIDTLAKDATRHSDESRRGSRSLGTGAYGAVWVAGAALILALSFWLLPLRGDFSERIGNLDLAFLFLLWSLATLLPAMKVYALAFPDGALGATARRLTRFVWVPFAGLALFTAGHLRFADFAYQLHRESSYLNGGCGMVIFVAGALHASLLLAWIRKGATTSPARAGAWAAVSTASFASFIVQFACANENPLHVLFWHFLPLLALTGLAALSARRLLRW